MSLSLMGTKVLGSIELSLPGVKVRGNESSIIPVRLSVVLSIRPHSNQLLLISISAARRSG